jgi:hypothetical protein
MAISFTQNHSADSMIKDDSTVADLIGVLKELPQNLKIDGHFQVHVVGGEVIFLQDQRVTDLMDIIVNCPLCSSQLQEQEREVLN